VRQNLALLLVIGCLLAALLILLLAPH